MSHRRIAGFLFSICLTWGLAATAPEYNDSSAETSITVLPYRAPSGTLQVSPAEIWAGEKATLSARFDQGQCAGPSRDPELSANEGTVSGNVYDSSAVQFDPSDNSEQRKTITLHARVADQKGVAAAEASVLVKKKAVLAAKRLPDIVFPANSGRVNNCGKRVLLEELKSLIDRDPTGTVAFVGHVTDKEKSDLDRKRVSLGWPVQVTYFDKPYLASMLPTDRDLFGNAHLPDGSPATGFLAYKNVPFCWSPVAPPMNVLPCPVMQKVAPVSVDRVFGIAKSAFRWWTGPGGTVEVRMARPPA